MNKGIVNKVTESVFPVTFCFLDCQKCHMRKSIALTTFFKYIPFLEKRSRFIK